jgi:hypothetical protein
MSFSHLFHSLSFDRQPVAKQKGSRQTIPPKEELYKIIKDWPIENKRMKLTILAPAINIQQRSRAHSPTAGSAPVRCRAALTW